MNHPFPLLKHLATLLGKRLAGLVTILLGVSLLTFTLYYISPGDKALTISNARYMGEGDVPPEVVEAIREEFALDEPFPVQFWHWISGFLQGDFGKSLVSQEDVLLIFLPNLAETLELAATALALGLSLAFLLSLVSVWKPGSIWDRLAVAFSSIGAAVPSYWLGLILILVFAAKLQWLPSFGSGSLEQLVLPAVTLGFWITTSQTRLLRTFLLEASEAPFIEALRLRGVPEGEIFRRHILRHAMIPAIAMIGLDFAALLEGSIIVEVIFSRGGVGSLFVGSILSRDYPLLLFLVLFAACSYVILNSLIELLQDWLSPHSLQGNRPSLTGGVKKS
ncbi:ABC transporter permease [Kiloniella sp. b19]|uniref:ABC transporter permease n=1 Tax=Kiloniella sp. GXU_MW_B19 TaxID=3141326 RepID=UPI0031D5CC89